MMATPEPIEIPEKHERLHSLGGNPIEVNLFEWIGSQLNKGDFVKFYIRGHGWKEGAFIDDGYMTGDYSCRVSEADPDLLITHTLMFWRLTNLIWPTSRPVTDHKGNVLTLVRVIRDSVREDIMRQKEREVKWSRKLRDHHDNKEKVSE